MKYAEIAIINGYKKIRILPLFIALDAFAYAIGDVVEVPIGNDRGVGIIMNFHEQCSQKTTPKTLGRIIVPHYLSPLFVAFIEKIAKYHFCHPSVFLQKIFTSGEKKGIFSTAFPLLKKQEKLTANNNFPDIFIGSYASGKNTEVLKKMKESLVNDTSVLFIVPTYLSVVQAEKLLKQNFLDENIFCFHSYTTAVQRQKIAKSMQENKRNIIIGTPSSLFLPWKEIGTIIVNEYNDESYSEIFYPFLSWTYIIKEFAKTFSIPLILTSCLENIEDFIPENRKKCTIHKFPSIVNTNVYISDLNLEQEAGNKSPLSRIAIQKIKEALEKKTQVLIHLNKKGLHWAMICEKCGYAPTSPFSGLKMGVFQNSISKKFYLRCSASGHTEAPSLTCPKCSGNWKMIGSGTQDIENIISKEFPSTRILRVDKDSMSSKGKIDDAIEKINNKSVDIIIGTSFVAKGFAFKNVSTVIDVRSDIPLLFSFIGNEEIARFRIAQLQDKIGYLEDSSIILQTFFPQHSIFSKKTHWISSALSLRKQFSHPPYSEMVKIVASGKKKETIEKKLTADFLALKPFFFHLFPIRISFFEKTQQYEGSIQGFLKKEHFDDLFFSSAEIERII